MLPKLDAMRLIVRSDTDTNTSYIVLSGIIVKQSFYLTKELNRVYAPLGYVYDLEFRFDFFLIWQNYPISQYSILGKTFVFCHHKSPLCVPAVLQELVVFGGIASESEAALLSDEGARRAICGDGGHTYMHTYMHACMHNHHHPTAPQATWGGTRRTRRYCPPIPIGGGADQRCTIYIYISPGLFHHKILCKYLLM